MQRGCHSNNLCFSSKLCQTFDIKSKKNANVWSNKMVKKQRKAEQTMQLEMSKLNIDSVELLHEKTKKYVKSDMRSLIKTTESVASRQQKSQKRKSYRYTVIDRFVLQAICPTCKGDQNVPDHAHWTGSGSLQSWFFSESTIPELMKKSPYWNDLFMKHYTQSK